LTSIDPSDGKSVSSDPSMRGRTGRSAGSATAENCGGRGHGHSEIHRQLKRLSAEALAGILLRIFESHEDELRPLIEEALRQSSEKPPPDGLGRNTGTASGARRGGRLLTEDGLREAFERHGRSVTRVARALGVSRMTVYRAMRHYGTRRQSDNADAP
jgi:DNA-binding NtrC family response regulator